MSVKKDIPDWSLPELSQITTAAAIDYVSTTGFEQEYCKYSWRLNIVEDQRSHRIKERSHEYFKLQYTL